MNKGDIIFLSNSKFFENFFSDSPIKNKLGRFGNGMLISENHNPQFFHYQNSISWKTIQNI